MIEDKLLKFFKEKKVTNKFLASQTGYSESMVGRYLKDPNLKFILKLLEYYDIDLNYILKERPEMEHLGFNESRADYQGNNEDLLNIIERATSQLRANLAQN